MPFTLTCPTCGRTGFIRRERVIDHGKPSTHYECGACGYRWQEPDPPPSDRSDHARGKK
jgi:rubredoxin